MVFESSHDFCKKTWGEKVDSYLLIPKAFLAGFIGSALSNSFDVLTIQKQIHPERKVLDIIKQERWGIFTKGIHSRVLYYSLNSTILFCIIN
jgi:hypothetical protein